MLGNIKMFKPLVDFRRMEKQIYTPPDKLSLVVGINDNYKK
jgi:hypothetical protein